MGFYLIILANFSVLRRKLYTALTSFQHKIIFFSKSQPRVHSKNILKISQISALLHFLHVILETL